MTLDCAVPYCLATHYALTPVTASRLRGSAIDAGWVAVGLAEWALDWFCPCHARLAATWLNATPAPTDTPFALERP